MAKMAGMCSADDRHGGGTCLVYKGTRLVGEIEQALLNSRGLERQKDVVIRLRVSRTIVCLDAGEGSLHTVRRAVCESAPACAVCVRSRAMCVCVLCACVCVRCVWEAH